MVDLHDCKGFTTLKAAVARDYEKDRRYQAGGKPFHDYNAKLQWVIARAEHYAETLGIDACDILNAWEKDRNYWYMNYYQDAKQPRIDNSRVRVFDTADDLKASIERPAFRCPMCNGVSTDAYVCNTGDEMAPGQVCDWKVYGLFGSLGKGTFVYVKDQLTGHEIFTPVAWEKDHADAIT